MPCGHNLMAKRGACYEFCPICLDDTLRMERLRFSIERVQKDREIRELRQALATALKTKPKLRVVP